MVMHPKPANIAAALGHRPHDPADDTFVYTASLTMFMQHGFRKQFGTL